MASLQNELGIGLAKRISPWGIVLLVTAAVCLSDSGMSWQSRFTISVFIWACAFWVLTSVNDLFVALVAAMTVIIAGIIPSQKLYGAMGGSLAWLLIASFMLAAVLRQTGAAERLGFALLRHARSIRQIFYALTGFITATAFLIPSTSGRAALILPLFVALAAAVRNERVACALALLCPTIVLLTAFGSVNGAGAHLIAIETMAQAGVRTGFLEWALLAAPVAVVSALVATEVILRLFLTPQDRMEACQLCWEARPFNPQQRNAAVISLLAVMLWIAQPVHGLDVAVVALACAAMASVPALTGVSVSSAVKGVEWEMLLFLAAAMALGDALLASGAVSDLMKPVASLFDPAGPHARHVQAFAGLFVVVSVSLMAHLVLTSRSARAAILVPAFAAAAPSMGLDPAATAMLVVGATGFSQTLVVSSKPITLFAAQGVSTFTQRDLLTLSAALLPVVFLIFLGAALFWWPLMGLPLQQDFHVDR